MRNIITATLLLMAAANIQAEVTNVDNDELKALLASGIPIIDVRTAPEWKQTGVIDGSHLMTFFDEKGRYDMETWLKQLSSVAGKEQPFILVCRSGNRTGTISKFLNEKLAYSKVYNVKNGIREWIAKGNPIVTPTL